MATKRGGLGTLIKANALQAAASPAETPETAQSDPVTVHPVEPRLHAVAAPATEVDTEVPEEDPAVAERPEGPGSRAGEGLVTAGDAAVQGEAGSSGPDAGESAVRSARTRRPAARRVAPPPVPAPASVGEGAGRPVNRMRFMERKEVYLWPDQLDDLRDWATDLQRARGRGVSYERFTANTLLRTAVDLLMTHRDTLVGLSENDLRVALGLPERDDEGTVLPPDGEG